MSEIAEAIGVSRVQISSLLEKITSTAPVPAPQADMIGLIRTQLSANTALLKEAIKVGFGI